MERREYSNEEINSLFTPLDGENDDVALSEISGDVGAQLQGKYHSRE